MAVEVARQWKWLRVTTVQGRMIHVVYCESDDGVGWFETGNAPVVGWEY